MRPSDLKSLKGFLAAIRDELRSLSQIVSGSAAAISNEHIAGNRANHQEREENRGLLEEAVAILRAKQKKDAAVEPRLEHRHGQNLSVQRWLTVGTWLAFLAASIYAGLAYRQWQTMNYTYGEMQKQTVAAQVTAAAAQQQATLMKQQMEATQDAVIDMGYNNNRPELTGIDEPFGPNDPKLSVWIKNSGHANAREVVVEMKISVREISDDSRGLFHDKKDLSLPPLPPSSPGEDGTPLDFKNIIPVAYVGKINNTEATLRIEGVVRYNNGIDTAQVQEPFCYSFIRYPKHGGFVQCFDFDDEVANFRKSIRQISNGK